MFNVAMLSDADLDQMIESLRPTLEDRDVAGYEPLLPEGLTVPPSSDVLAPWAPEDEAAVDELVSRS